MSFLDDTIGSLGKISSFAKLTIKHETRQRAAFDGTIEALFNPSQLRYDNRAEWCVTGTVAQAIAGGLQRIEPRSRPPATLSLDLFFDTHGGEPGAGTEGRLDSQHRALAPDHPFSAGAPRVVDVTPYTDAVAELVRVQSELHRPPVCRLQWGRAVLFEGVLTRLHQDFTYFMPDGTPVRATLGCTFTAYRTSDNARRGLDI